MLVVVEKGKEGIIQGIFDKWDLHCAQIGEVIAAGPDDAGRLYFHQHGELIADVPAYDLVPVSYTHLDVYKRQVSTFM